MWPTFSAIRTSTTGKKRTIALILNDGLVKCGIATHFAALNVSNFTSPCIIPNTYPTTTPPKILIRLMKPFVTAPMSATATRVTIATNGPFWKLPFAAPAKLRPMIMTIDPVTTGGSSQLTHPIPNWFTIKPTTASNTPVATTPPSATAIPPLVTAAAIGAKKANDEPK